MISTDSISTIAYTGTAGNTLTSVGDMDGIIGTVLSNPTIMIGGIVLFLIAHLLDRKYSHPMFEDAWRLEEDEDK